jgi:microcystin-dependent protein
MTVKKISGKYILRSALAMVVFLAALSLVPEAKAQVGQSPYLGEILAVPYNFAPAGWTFCNGQILSLQQNTALFSLLGTTYGGNGTTNFALPDLRGRTPISSGNGPGLSQYDLGETGGEEQVTLTVSQIPAHSHVPNGTSVAGTTASPAGEVWATQTRVNVFSSAANAAMAPLALALVGGGQPHDNRSPYLTLNYVIALEGIYPSRN